MTAAPRSPRAAGSGTRPALIPLQRFASRLRVGSPLPFNVRDAQGELLLARGQAVADEATRQSLLAHGVGIDAEELREVQARLDVNKNAAAVPAPATDTFFEHWQNLQARLRSLLRDPMEFAFLQRVRECAAMVINLTEVNPDRLIFAVMRHDHSRYANYGSAHALHVASLCCLLARRSDWPQERLMSLVGAALTMNLSIIELQGMLAVRGGILSTAQRRSIDKHPTESGALLRQAGLDDEDWLTAVEQHHEDAQGTGYPARIQNPTELAELLRFVDIFLAKHAGRADRGAVPPQQAARDLYMASSGHPVAAMLIKEIGIFPPGCYVKLANGEVAVVVRRGAHASMPLVCAIANAKGDPLPMPQRRDTADAAYAITGSLADKAVKVQVQADRLYSIAMA